MRQIRVLNHSTVVSSGALSDCLSALTIQMQRDYAPAWGLQAQLVSNQVRQASYEQLIVLDDTDQADALGYHEFLAQTQQPIGFCFARTAQQDGVAWSSVLSHELLEQLLDPYCTLTFSGQQAGKPAQLVGESADPVEDTTYRIGVVTVSNFVTRPWFSPDPKVQGPFDHLGVLTGPGTLTSGGYLTIANADGTWTEVFGARGRASAYRERLHASPYSRHFRYRHHR